MPASASGSAVEGPAPAEKLPRRLLGLYGLPNLPVSVVALPIALYVPAFYSENLGLDLATVGLVLMLSRLTDVFTDPMIGIVSDKWETRFGRRKPWILVGIPLLMVSIWLLFVPPGDVTALYLFVWISLLYLSATFIELPYRAWGAELSTDYHERSKVTGWREGFGYLGILLSLLIPIVMAFGLGRPGPSNALRGIAVAVVILLPLLMLPSLALVPEPPPERIDRPRVSWGRGLRIVWRNGPFRRTVVCLTFFVIAISMTATLSFFFVRRVMEEPFDRYALFILAYYLSSTAAIPLWLRLSYRIGKHRTLVAGIVWLSIWSAPIPLLGPGDFWTFFGLMILKGSAVGSLVFLATSMAADIVDLDTARTGEQRTGLFFSILGMILKGAAAVGVFLATTGVDHFGFDPRIEENTAAAKLAVACLYSVVPAAIALIALPLLWAYPLTRERQERLRTRIDRRNRALAER